MIWRFAATASVAISKEKRLRLARTEEETNDDAPALRQHNQVSWVHSSTYIGNSSILPWPTSIMAQDVSRKSKGGQAGATRSLLSSLMNWARTRLSFTSTARSIKEVLQ